MSWQLFLSIVLEYSYTKSGVTPIDNFAWKKRTIPLALHEIQPLIWRLPPYRLKFKSYFYDTTKAPIKLGSHSFDNKPAVKMGHLTVIIQIRYILKPLNSEEVQEVVTFAFVFNTH